MKKMKLLIFLTLILFSSPFLYNYFVKIFIEYQLNHIQSKEDKFDLNKILIPSWDLLVITETTDSGLLFTCEELDSKIGVKIPFTNFNEIIFSFFHKQNLVIEFKYSHSDIHKNFIGCKNDKNNFYGISVFKPEEAIFYSNKKDKILPNCKYSNEVELNNLVDTFSYCKIEL